MTQVQIYLFAPKRKGRKEWVRSVKIEEASFSGDGRSYSPGRVLVDAEIPCDKDTPDQCLVIRGTVEAVV